MKVWLFALDSPYVSHCLHTGNEFVTITSLVLCHLEVINVIRLLFRKVKIYIDALMVLIKVQMEPSTCSMQYAVYEIEVCA